MRYCHNCHRLTANKPLFCSNCGCTYGVKLCPRLHVSPKAAQICSQCGSRDLSTPHPKIPILLRPFVVLLDAGPAVLILFALCIWVVFYIRQLLNDPNSLLPLLLIALTLGGLLYGWMRLPPKGRRK
jgi:RNA polymerase subunit RPABC4/transcription elongation factor Spt4